MLGAAGPAQTGGHGGIIFASIFVGAIMGAFGKTYLDKRNANYIPI
jgi:H+/Cl- antiporter ClcA